MSSQQASEHVPRGGGEQSQVVTPLVERTGPRGEIANYLTGVQNPEGEPHGFNPVGRVYKSIDEREICTYWEELAIEGPKGNVRAPILWNERSTRTPPRLVHEQDVVPEPLPIGWEEVDLKVVRDPSGDIWVRNDNGVLYKVQSREETITASHAQPVQDWLSQLEEDGWLDEDGMRHYGEHSAIVPDGCILSSRDQVGGPRVPGQTTDAEFVPQEQTLPDQNIIVRQPLVAAGVGADIHLPFNGMYGTITSDHVAAEYPVTSNVCIAALPGDLLTVHGQQSVAAGIAIDVTADANLSTFLSKTTPMGDTRALTGLNDVIYVQQRTDLLGQLRNWVRDGTMHRGSELGYAKLWLYVFTLMIRDQIDHDFPGQTWNFANNAANNRTPAVDDRYTDRGCWTLYGDMIRSQDAGWLTLDEGATVEVAYCCADFYYSFPNWTVTATNNVVGTQPAPLGHHIPGVDRVCITFRRKPAVLGPNPAQPTEATIVRLAARTAPPTIANYISAIIQMKTWRDEAEDEAIGFQMAISMAGCLMRETLHPIVGVAPRRWPAWGYGGAGRAIRWHLPICNTLVAAYTKGSTQREFDLGGRDTITRPVILSMIHKFAICVNDSYQRVIQLLSVTTGACDARLGIAAAVNERGFAVNILGPLRMFDPNFCSAVFKYAFRVFGIRTSVTSASMLVGRSVWQVNFRHSLFGPTFASDLYVPAHMCAIYRTHARKPWQWEMLLCGCSQQEPAVHRTGAVGRRADYINTQMSDVQIPQTQVVGSASQFTEFLVMIARCEESEPGAYPALRTRRRWTQSEDATILSGTAETLNNALAPVAGLPGFRMTASWYVAFDVQNVRIFRNEVARIDGRMLTPATISRGRVEIRQAAIDLSQHLPGGAVPVLHVNELRFPELPAPDGEENHPQAIIGAPPPVDELPGQLNAGGPRD
jgi:hypothetical protein